MAAENILISACLLGEKVRYDGADLLLEDEIMSQWQQKGVLQSICPEVAGGLGIPRPAAEIQQRTAMPIRVITVEKFDVTKEFTLGAKLALQKCKENKIRMAILTEGSPSCGQSLVNDGNFNKTKIKGEGVTAALLNKSGIKVFSQHQLKKAFEYYQKLTSVKPLHETKKTEK